MSQHIVNGIFGMKDSDGNINTYVSPLLKNKIDTTDNSKLNKMEHVHKIIGNIKYISDSLGLSSSRMCGVCEFDNKKADDIKSMKLKASELFDFYYPYNIVNMNTKNTYKFDCLTLYYKMQKNILYIKNTFPGIINIKRSSGIIQKAFINSENAFSLYKTRKDNYKNYHIGLKINFNDGNDEIDEDTEYGTLKLSKIIFLEDVLEYNPDIKNIEFVFELLDINKYLNSETIEEKHIVKDVITYFNNIYLEWVQKMITKEFVKYENISLTQII